MIRCRLFILGSDLVVDCFLCVRDVGTPELMGVLGAVDERTPEKPDKIRVVCDLSLVGPNWLCQQQELQEFPGPEELIAILQWFRGHFADEIREGGLFVLKFDFSAAFKRIKVKEDHQTRLGFIWQGVYYVWTHFPFGYSLSGFYWGRMIAIPFRMLKKLLYNLLPATGGLIFVDDGSLVFLPQDRWRGAGVSLLFLALIGSPLSWRKTVLNQNFDWVGFQFATIPMQVGLPYAKFLKIGKALVELLQGTSKWSYLKLRTLVFRLGSWARVNRFIKPFLRRAFGVLAQTC